MDQVESIHRNIEAAPARVFKNDEFPQMGSYSDLLQPSEHADSMVEMDDEITFPQIAEIRDEDPGLIREAMAVSSPRLLGLAEDLRLRNHLQAQVAA